MDEFLWNYTRTHYQKWGARSSPIKFFRKAIKAKSHHVLLKTLKTARGYGLVTHFSSIPAPVKLVGHLKNHDYKYSLGYLMKNDGVYHEKGVDVNIAVDILVATYEDLCDRIILVSSDTDLIPAVKKAKEKGKIVEYVGFSHKPSVALVARCSESHLLKKEDIEPFVKVEFKEK